MDKYYFFGEFGFLNLEILGGLERYFSKHPKKKLQILTYSHYADLLEYLFPRNIFCIRKTWEDDVKNKNPSRVGHNSGNLKFSNLNFQNLHILFQNKGIPKFIIDFMPTGGRRINLLKKYLSYTLEKKDSKKYISIFPRKRAAGGNRNLSYLQWDFILDYLMKNYPFYKFVVHGAGKEFLKFKGDRFIYPKGVLEQIYYLNNSLGCISCDSGVAHFSLNCNCDTFVVGRSYEQFFEFNPFKNRLWIYNFREIEKNPNRLKYFLEGKKKSFILRFFETTYLYFKLFFIIFRYRVIHPFFKKISPKLFVFLRKKFQ